MKHLLNNLSEEEKNSIRGQHTGGMQVNNGRFNSLLENKLGNSKPLVEQFDDEEDYEFEDEFESDEELYRGAPERLVKHMDSGKIVGTHKHGVGYTPNEFGKSLGHSSHPTSIPNYTKMEDLDSLGGMNVLRMSNPNKGRRYRDLEEDTSWMNDLNEGDEEESNEEIFNLIDDECVNSKNDEDCVTFLNMVIEYCEDKLYEMGQYGGSDEEEDSEDEEELDEGDDDYAPTLKEKIESAIRNSVTNKDEVIDVLEAILREKKGHGHVTKEKVLKNWMK